MKKFCIFVLLPEGHFSAERCERLFLHQQTLPIARCVNWINKREARALDGVIKNCSGGPEKKYIASAEWCGGGGGVSLQIVPQNHITKSKWKLKMSWGNGINIWPSNSFLFCKICNIAVISALSALRISATVFLSLFSDSQRRWDADFPVHSNRVPRPIPGANTFRAAKSC